MIQVRSMKLNREYWLGIIGAVIAIILILFTIYTIQKETSISDILANPDHYDHEIVIIRGNVFAYQERISRFGNEYTLFVLTDGGSRIRVYSRGHKNLKNGQDVVVRGLYRKVTRMGRYIFLNEIEARHIGSWSYIF